MTRQPGVTYPITVATLEQVRGLIAATDPSIECECPWANPAPVMAQWPSLTALIGVRHAEPCPHAADVLELYGVVIVPGHGPDEIADSGRWSRPPSRDW